MNIEWSEIAQGVGSIASAIISLLGFIFVYRQIKQTNANLKQSNHTAIYSINTELYKFFAENSELRPYFYDGKPLTEEDKNKILSVSELFADFFEFILVEKNALAPQIREPWLNYMKKIYRNSPGFRFFLHENKDHYCEELLAIFAIVAPSITEASLTCRALINENEFIEVDKIYQVCFSESSVPTEKQKEWWEKQPKGIIALFLNEKIIGGISYWNLTQEAFNNLRQGILKERNITAFDLADGNEGFMYISETAISNNYRNNKYSFLLLRSLIIEIEALFKENKRLTILALGYSVEGETLLNKIGFVKILDAAQTEDNQPLYMLKINSIAEILTVKKALL